MMTDERPAPPSDRFLLVQARFDTQNLGPVGEWIAARRAEGLSWAHVSWALRDAVGVEVSYETLRRWSTMTDEEGPS